MKFDIAPEALSYLSRCDKDMNRIIEAVGPLCIDLNEDVFVSIVHCIISQQLSNKAADSICTRVHNQVADFSPHGLLGFGIEGLKSCGVSSNKARYIIELAENIEQGAIDLSLVNTLPDEDIVPFLTQIKGVGVWTAEMIALFTLGRPNIFSYSDVALLNAIMKYKGYKTLSKKRFEGLRKRYSPYCSIASMYYYTAYDEYDIVDGIVVKKP